MSEFDVDGDTIAEVIVYLNGHKTVTAKRMADAVLRLLNRHYQDAAALEASWEDAERLDWLAGDALMISGWREHGKWETPALLVDSTREACTPRDFRAAIDQARGKGVDA